MTLLTTGLSRQLQLPLIVTELVVDAEDAHPPEAVDDAGLITISRMGPSRIEDDPQLKVCVGACSLRTFLTWGRRRIRPSFKT